LVDGGSRRPRRLLHRAPRLRRTGRRRLRVDSPGWPV